MSDFLTRRGSTWHFVRRVPVEFAELDKRGIVRHSTRMKVAEDRTGRKAARIAESLNEELECFWRGLARGQTAANTVRYDDLRRRARSLGFDYVPNSDLLTLSQSERLDRIEALLAKGLTQDASAREALLGTAPKPSLKVSQLFEVYDLAVRDETRAIRESG